ncbi:type II secretion system minor pseudopilin GspK [Trinickia diaoshuihuensis]|uniref:type II secretion system minor pseudopilin GspK n=1 Tax=Trinickia diaoshuihuensis TaxID=2292265 RepID=UPI000E242C23|nr:type II secretion system minor pseudopilin GspK [Trinickia diaoshuihuensis]
MHEPTRARDLAVPRERGIAIVTVLLVVALTATLAASVLWREQVATRDVENQRLSMQTMWAERAAVEWARATLRAQTITSNATYAGQSWAVPVGDTRLADFLPPGAAAVNGELARASISGSVEDAQARLNLSDLVERSAPGQPWRANPQALLAYRRLLEGLSLDPALAKRTADYIARSLSQTPTEGKWPLQLVGAADLARVDGYDAHAIETLTPYVTFLPEITTVNANTAPEPVLVAAIPTLATSQARRIVERRATAHFVSTGELAEYLAPVQAGATLPEGALVGVDSGYFLVHCRVRGARINVRIDTLIARYGIGNFSWTQVVWVHRLTG